MLVVGKLGPRLVVGGVEERPACGLPGAILLAGERGSGREVMTEGLAVVGIGVEHTVGVEPLGPVGPLGGAWPLDPGAAAQPVVREPGVVARTTARACLPRLERRLGVVPADERPAVAVAEVHPPGVIEEDVEVRTGFAGRIDGALREVHGAVGVGERAELLAPRRRRQHDVGEPGRLGEEEVLDDHEQVRLGQDPADPVELRQRRGGVGARHPQQTDRSLLGVAEDLHGMRRRRPVRDHHRLDVPQRSELFDVRGVVPVAHPRQVAVGAGLAVVLRSRLPVHLEHAGAGPSEHPAQQVDVVDLARRRCRLPVATKARRPAIERNYPRVWPHKSNQRECRRGS